jgi:hypothetical protein
MNADWWPWWVSTLGALVLAAVALVLFSRSRDRRVRIGAAALAVVALGAAFAAPFVMDSEDRLTKEEYARQADANCAALNRFAATLGPANTLPETERYMDRFMPEFRKALEKQDELVPPKAEERRAEKWMTAMEALGHELDAIRDGAKRGDQSAVASANQRSARHVNESTRLSKQLGMRVCFS